ncbi:flavin-dependent oxidoreductase [Streptomyces sp. NPDC006733]|uniref:flavin-dependent oxidoreductase n=1 Tax=Streptomyces sp. NPDC006733 TaxID=3155460 RepID=UPI003406379F
MNRVVIAGGGIAGLTAALSLHAAGRTDVLVVEAAPEVQPVGAGLNIMPNAVRELAALGLYEELAAVSVPTSELRYYHSSGSLVWREPRGIGAGYRWPQLSIHRGRLQEVLARAVRERLGRAAVLAGARVEDFAELPGARLRVAARNRAGGARTDLDAEILIGADGIRSAVRAAMYPGEGAPPWNGVLVWRGVSWMPADRVGTFMFIAGNDRQKAVVYPLTVPAAPGERVLVNWALAMPAERGAAALDRSDWNRPVPVDRFRRHYEGWVFDGVDVGEVIDAAEAAFEYPMVDREPLVRWTFGGVTLIGDAAHAMYPIGSNGATQSIIDGRALAHAMAAHEDPARALLAYEAERRPPMTELQRSNRRLGPEVVINMAHERAPGGFTDIHDVIPRTELETIARRYAVAGAFDPASVNQGSPYDAPAARAAH